MRWLRAAGILLALLVPCSVEAQSEPTIHISSPASGEALQGMVEITGTSAVEGFLSSELSFAYATDSSGTWFLIYSTDAGVREGLLAVWDTSLITDGDYVLRLRVTLQDGSLLETTVTGLRIRNWMPTETATAEPTDTPELLPPSPSAPLPPTPQPAATATHAPTPTPLPPNPVAVTQSDIRNSLGRGILITLLVFLLTGILIRLRRS
jgi:hypothetical protein